MKGPFSQEMETVLEVAEAWAASGPLAGFPSVGTYHLVVGILSEGGLAARFLTDLGVTLETYCEAYERSFGIVKPDGMSLTIEPVFGDAQEQPMPADRYMPATAQALDRAAELASGTVRPIHLLAAILEQSTVGSGLVEEVAAVPRRRLREMVSQQLQREG